MATVIHELIEDSRGPKGWGYRHPYDLTGKSEHQLPQIRCPKCGLLGLSGPLHYPSVPAADVAERLGAVEEWVEPAEFPRIAESVSDLFGVDRPIGRGASVGRFVGAVRGRLGDFLWPFQERTILVRESVLRLLSDHGMELRGDWASLRLPAREKERFFEIEIPPTVRSDPQQISPPCDMCGETRLVASRYDVRFLASSVDPEAAFLRGFDLPQTIFVSPRVVALAKEHGFRNFRTLERPLI